MLPADKIKAFHKKIPVWKQLYFKWRSLTNVPFRKKFFIGYDLDGNTYWEFYLEGKGKNIRPRRVMEPYKPEALLLNYFEKVPIQWTQWLKFSRKTPPSIFDIVADEERVRKLQILAEFKENEQLYNKELKQQKIDANLQNELQKLQQQASLQAENAAKILEKTGHSVDERIEHKEIKSKSNAKLQTDASKLEENDPWKSSAQASDKPEEATITPRR
jgi:NADH dehydrogenase [ubiquinone] 1 alpha subcomplex assembly factor 2